jgi:hypothetical protein
MSVVFTADGTELREVRCCSIAADLDPTLVHPYSHVSMHACTYSRAAKHQDICGDYLFVRVLQASGESFSTVVHSGRLTIKQAGSNLTIDVSSEQ